MKRFMGGLLVAVGALLAGTTGLCTVAVIAVSIPNLIERPIPTLSASPLLLAGIVPCIVGVFVTAAGLSLLRKKDQS